MGLSSFIFLWWALKKLVFSAIKCVSAVQSHPKVDDFGTNQKRMCDFPLVRHCNNLFVLTLLPLGLLVNKVVCNNGSVLHRL